MKDKVISALIAIGVLFSAFGLLVHAFNRKNKEEKTQEDIEQERLDNLALARETKKAKQLLKNENENQESTDQK